MTDLIELLNKRGIQYKKTNNPAEILIGCTSGQHTDKSPSLSFNLEKNIFNCWSCGFRGGINKFLQSIGETQNIDFDSKQPYKLKKLKDKIQAKIETNEIQLPDDRRMFNEEFRGISAETYKKFGAFTTNELGLTDYLCIPVYQHGKLKFIEGRLLKDLPNQPKYYRRPQKAVASDCLFPLDKLKNTNYVILVEGIFDAINMWQNGFVNTLCIFGTTNFNKKKLGILDSMGVTRVDIMMDSDAAGQKAAEKIFELLDSRNIYSRIITLPPGIDPGELTKEQAERLLR
jgi:DNA primase